MPHAKKEEPAEEQFHDADDFVPRQDRAATLDHGVETFVIGDDKEDDIKQEDRELERCTVDLNSVIARRCTPEVPHAKCQQAGPEETKAKEEDPSRTPASEQVGTQPAPTKLSESSAVLNGACASACAHSAPISQSDNDVFGFSSTFKQTPKPEKSLENQLKKHSFHENPPSPL